MSSSWGQLGNMNSSYPMGNAFTGGSFALPSGTGNTLENIFSPGASIQAPSVPILDPYAGKLHSRFEVPDTSRTVNLGEIVMFTMQSNNENFLTNEILPMVPWGWAVRTFDWSVWNFPQHPVYPTPETAPPRFLSSMRLSETTSMIRFAIGQHMSSEYANTAMGKANQGYNLKQMEYSIQEGFNNMVVRALHGSQRQHRQRMEKLGSYKVVDLNKAMIAEVKQFARPQKEEHGFRTLFEEITTQMAEFGGRATAAILTTKLNTLVLTRPELIEYDRAGPAGPALVKSPNRTFLDGGITVYFTKVYPGRFGADAVGMWQKNTQIGNYHKSMELAEHRSGDANYAANYRTQQRAITIYNQETDAYHTISAEEMLENCYAFDKEGRLRAIDDPPGNRHNRANKVAHDAEDFLTFEKGNHEAPATIDEVFSGKAPRRDSLAALGRDRVFPKTLEVFGQLRKEDFAHEDVRETGAMISARIAEADGSTSTAKTLSGKIAAGLQLYVGMCKREVDLDFLNYAVKSNAKNAYQRQYGSLRPLTFDAMERSNKLGVDPRLTMWQDVEAPDERELNRRINAATLVQEPGKIPSLKNANRSSDHLPLPLDSEIDFPEIAERNFGNLTGYASYGGFKAMSEAYRSGNQNLSKRYNVEELKIAAEFVEALEHSESLIRRMLPGCQCFENQDGKATGEIIAEQLMNMVGFDLWVNKNKTKTFIVDAKRVADLKSRNVNSGAAGLYRGGAIAPTNAGFWDAYREIIGTSLTRYYGGDSLDSGNIITDFELAMKNQLDPSNKKITASVFKKAREALQGVPMLGDAAGYAVSDKATLMSIVRGWYVPNVTRNNDDGLQSALLGVAPIDDERSWDNVGLALSTANANDSFLPLFGPLRLQLYSSVMQAALVAAAAYKDNFEKFLKSLLTLNLLMLPDVEGVKIGGASYDLDLGASRDATRGRLNLVSAARALAYPPTAGEIGTPALATSFFKMLDEIFAGSSGDIATSVTSIKRDVERARKEETEWRTELTQNGAGTTIRLPFLQGIFKRKNDAVVQTYGIDNAGDPKLVPLGEIGTGDFITGLIKTSPTNFISKAFGKTYRDVPSEFASASQAGVSGRGRNRTDRVETFEHGRLLRPTSHLASDDFDAGGDYDDVVDDDGSGAGSDPGLDLGTDDPAFVKTNLTVSSDQLASLFSKNGPADSRNLFDVRVTNPRRPDSFVSLNAQDDMLRTKDDVRRKHVASLSSPDPERLGVNRVPWVDVPYLKAEDRVKNTFFGPSTVDPSGYRGPIAGLRMRAHFTRSFVRACRHLDTTLNAADRFAALLYMCTTFTKRACLSLLHNNARLPFNFLVVRPHMNYLMELCALVDPGIDTLGFLAIAGKDYTVGFTTLTKEMYGNLSYWAGTVITHPENCAIVRNVAFDGYGPGGGVKWFDPARYNPARLGDHKTPTNGSESLMCMVIPFTKNVTKDYISVSGKLQHLETGGHGGSTSILRTNADEGEDFPTATRYNAIWGWRDPPDSQLMDTLGNEGYALFNKICWSGMTFYSGPACPTHSSGHLTHMTRNKGHCGPEQGPGCQEVYAGHPKSLPTFNHHLKYAVVS